MSHRNRKLQRINRNLLKKTQEKQLINPINQFSLSINFPSFISYQNQLENIQNLYNYNFRFLNLILNEYNRAQALNQYFGVIGIRNI